MPQIVIEKLLQGIAAKIGTLAAVEGRSNEYTRVLSAIDLYRRGFEGHISSPRIFDKGTITHANINSHIRAAAIDTTQTTPYTYLILGGRNGVAPRVERLENGSYSSTASHEIVADTGDNFTTLTSGTGFWGEDIVIYNVSGTNRVFYSWNDSDDGDVGTGTLVAGAPTYDDDFMSSVPTGAAKLQGNVPHRMVEGSDKVLYITNGRYVSSYDGSTNTFNEKRYDMGLGWITTDLRVYKSLLVIVGINCGSSYKTTTFNQGSRVCLWNMTEPHLGLVYEIRDGNASAAFVGENGLLYVFTSKPGGMAKLRRFNGSNFEIIKEWHEGFLGSIPQPNAIENYQGLIVWSAGNSSGILAYDPKYNGLHRCFVPNDGDVDASSIGMLKNLDQENLYISMLSGSTYELATLNDGSGYANKAMDLRTRLYALSYKATIKKIKVFFSQMASGSSAQFSLFKNYTTASIGTPGIDLWNETLDFATYGALTEYEFAKTIPNVSSFYLNIRLTGQVSVRAIVVDYEPSR